jgi:hypothetical protein
MTYSSTLPRDRSIYFAVVTHCIRSYIRHMKDSIPRQENLAEIKQGLLEKVEPEK